MRVLIVADASPRVQEMATVLAASGVEVVGRVVPEAWPGPEEDLVVLADLSVKERLARAQEEAVVWFGGDGETEEPTVSPSTPPREVRTIVALAARLGAVLRENRTLRRRLEDRKTVERAKGLLMRRLGVDEEEAYRLLRSEAMRRREELGAVARAVLMTDEWERSLQSQRVRHQGSRSSG